MSLAASKNTIVRMNWDPIWILIQQKNKTKNKYVTFINQTFFTFIKESSENEISKKKKIEILLRLFLCWLIYIGKVGFTCIWLVEQIIQTEKTRRLVNIINPTECNFKWQNLCNWFTLQCPCLGNNRDTFGNDEWLKTYFD